MKAIILAAGMGTRLGKYTENLPKGMLEFRGKSLIERQIETLRGGGIKDIVIVKGYAPEKINFDGVREYTNVDFANTNMVETLMCAREELSGDILVCYSDILYEKRVLAAATTATCDVGVVVDTDFQEYWASRLENPDEDHESLVIEDERIVELGTPDPGENGIHARYVGLIRFTEKGTEELLRVYDKESTRFGQSDEKWRNSKSFKKGYMTDMLQAMIDAGVHVTPIPVQRGWLEFDTVSDYESYLQWGEDGTMKRFFVEENA